MPDLKILLLEDDSLDAELIQEKLIHDLETGFVFRRVETRSDFLGAIEEFQPDVILSDYALPQYDGFQALDDLQATGKLIPFIMVTGRLGEEAAVEAIKTGAWDYVVKQRLDCLPAAVENALVRKRERLARRRVEMQNRILSNAAENAPVSVMITDKDAQILYVNPKFTQISGYTAEEVIGKTPGFLSSGKHPKAFYDNLWEQVLSGATFRAEMLNQKKDGSLYWEDVAISPILDDDGELARLVAVKADITERKLAQQELESRRKLWDAVMEQTPELVYFKDAQHRIIRASQAYADIYGLDAEELIGKTAADLWPGEAEQILADERHVFEGNTITNKVRKVTGPQGETRWYSLTKVPMYEEGEVVGFFAIDKEVTPRIEAEKALRESEERYRDLFNIVPVGIYRTTPDGSILDGNPATMEILGYPDEDTMLSSNIKDLYLEEEDRHRELELLEQEGYVENHVLKLRRYDGKVIWVQDSANVVRDEAGSTQYYYGRIEDITERVRAEQALRESENRYRTIFNTATVSIWEEDFSAVKAMIDRLKEEGVVDFGSYFDQYPEILDHIAAKIRVLDVNEETLRMFGAEDKEQLRDSVDDIFLPETMEAFKDEIVALAEGETYFRGETVNRTLDGRRLHILFTRSFPEQHEDFGSVLVSMIDITERKRAEEAEREERIFAEALEDTALALNSTLERDQILDRILDNISRVVPTDAANIMLIEGNYVDIVRHRGYSPSERETWQDLSMRISDRPNLARMTETKDPILIPDTRDSPHWKVVKGGEWIRSYVSAPIIGPDGEVIGFINLDHAEPNFFTRKHLRRLDAFSDQVATAWVSARLFADSQRRLEHLTSLRVIDQTITSSFDLEVSLTVLLDTTMKQLNIDAVAILVFEKERQMLEFAVGRGFRTDALKQTNLRLGEGQAGVAALEQRILHISDLTKRDTQFLRSPYFSRENFKAYFGVPLVAKGDVVGVMELFHRQALRPDREWMSFLETLAGQAAIAIDNISLFEELQQSNLELLQAYDATIQGWAQALELRDMETEGHSRRVVDLVMALAVEMGIRGEDLAHLRRGALLHDIGKMGVPDDLLQKKGSYTDEEREMMQQHPNYAHKWLSSIKYLQPALSIPYCHHEHWDGSGYPRGLEAEEIPLPARIFTVVDVWDALINDRSYRDAWPKDKAIEYIREQAGKYFDPEVVDVFLNKVLPKVT
jgi:PAS domain S-box-containing protein